jgi:hypothetical protein
MMASYRDFPSPSRIISELEGNRPGVSLYDIVSKYIDWDPQPAKKWGSPVQTLLFTGSKQQRIEASYRVTATASYQTKWTRRPPKQDTLTVSWADTHSQWFEIVCQADGRDSSDTLVQAYVKRGNNCFPVWGDPHPSSVQNPRGQMWSTNEQGTLLAARMHMAMSVDWTQEVLRDPPSGLGVMKDRYPAFFVTSEKDW